MSACTIYLVRHGQTAGNGNLYVGWEDLPLNATGQAQAQRAATSLAGVALDVIHCSPLARARNTALAIAAVQRGAARLLHDDALREIHYGEFQGLDKAARPLKLRHDHLDTPMPGGESLADVHTRVASFVSRQLPLWQGCRAVALVAHFWSLRMVLAALRGQDVRQMLDSRDYKPANGSTWVVTIDASQPIPACGPLRSHVAPEVWSGRASSPIALQAEGQTP